MALSPEDAVTLQAYGEAVDAARVESEAKWGMGRLERLAGLKAADLLARFRRQQATWSTALQAAYAADFLTRDLLDAVQAKAGAMQRAYAALDAWAEGEGHRPVAPWVWEAWLADGSVLAVVETDEGAGKVIAEGRYVQVYTVKEVARVIDLIPEALKLAKTAWPGSKFTGPDYGHGPKREWVDEGDPIPFGDDAAVLGKPANPPPGGKPQIADWQEDFA